MEQQRGKAGFGRNVDDKVLSPNSSRTAGSHRAAAWLGLAGAVLRVTEEK